MAHIFAERLKQARTERGMTVHYLAASAEVTFQQIHNYESGSQLPTLAYLVRLAQALDCSTDFLCGLED